MDAVRKDVVIANGEKVSSALQFPQGFYPTALILPTITTSTAVIFQVSMDGVTYYPLNNIGGSRYSFTIDPATANAVALDASMFYSWNYFKVEVADNQTGAKTIGVIVSDCTVGSPSSTLTFSGSDIEIGAVELKNASSDDRANISDANTARNATDHVLLVQNIGADGTVGSSASDVDDSAFTPATHKGQVVMATVTNDNVDQGDKGALSMTLDRRLRVDTSQFGDGFATYSNRRGDFTATTTDATKTFTITGNSFTTTASNIQRVIKIDSAGNRYEMPLTNVTVASEVVTLGDMPTAGFVTGDTVDVLMVGATKTYDRTLDVQKTIDQSPNWARYSADSIEDTTNVTTGTTYTISMDGYKNLSLTGKLIDGAGETTSMIVEGTNDEDLTSGDYIQIYGYDSKNNVIVASISATNTTTTYAWDFDNLNYTTIRMTITSTTATNTVIIKARRTY